VRILVTGGAGFIGSHVVRELSGSGHDVVVVDALLPFAHAGVPRELVPSVEYRWGDLADENVARKAVAGVDAVCHQAAMVGLGVDFGDVIEYVRHNDLATASLLRALHDDGFDGRIVVAGSMVVYGEGRYRCDRDGEIRPEPRAASDLLAGRWDPSCPACGADLRPEPVSEDAPPDPRNVYAATKLHQEHLCLLFGREHGVPVTALRFHNVYGSGMPRDTPYAGVASIFRSAIEAGDAPSVFEDGKQLRDFVHVRDVARANRLALEADPPCSGPLNVASGEPRTIFDLADALCRNASDGSLEPRIVGGYRLGDVRHVFAATDAIRERLGFQPEVNFAVGVAELATAPLRA
jgi:dTDP-L-rhamnose 4-epimerase